MNQPDNWKMTPLDALLCSNRLQILKTLIFFFPPAQQRQMILLTKFMELRECLTLPLSALMPFSRTADRSAQGTDILEHIVPYCDPQRQQTFRQMQNAFQMMRTIQQFSDSGMFDNLSEMMSGGGGFASMDAFAQMAGTDGTNDRFGSMFSSMMNPKQQALFKEYEAMLDDL